ncbi:hypothetical protein BKA69DRAFT_1175710 [Paraphysoderma sedebokerense]|nr:hypothetical protein BKA69DRAFT_1175710 [Paraphysoderma sedebokerense]
MEEESQQMEPSGDEQQNNGSFHNAESNAEEGVDGQLESNQDQQSVEDRAPVETDQSNDDGNRNNAHQIQDKNELELNRKPSSENQTIRNRQPHPPSHFRPPPPTIPSVWTEHKAPDGRPYWYNKITKQSSWHPPPEFAFPPPMFPPPIPPPFFPPHMYFPPPPIVQQAPRKDKAKEKKRIPGTVWSLVFTEAGKEFYYNTETKKSVWKVPEEIKDALFEYKKQLQQEEEAERQKQAEERKRKAEEEESEIAKRQKTDQFEETAEMTEADVEWQLAMMQDEGLLDEDAQEEQSHMVQQEPQKPIELEPEERVAVFKSLLADHNVSPFDTWDRILPKIIHDERYAVVKTLKERKEAFDAYCQERAEDNRKQKAAEKKKSPREAYMELLEQEVNPKMYWDDFRRKFKRDPRFSNFERDKDREKVFREFIDTLKVREKEKRNSEYNAVVDAFFQLLKENKNIHSDSTWKSVKRTIDHDKRYHAIRSSAEREELFEDYLKQLRQERKKSQNKREDEEKKAERRRREEESLRQRQRQVERDLKRRDYHMAKSKGNVLKEEATVALQTMLIDHVRNYDVPYSTALPDLQRDSRWQQLEILSEIEKRSIYKSYTEELYQKRIKSFKELLSKTVQDLKANWFEVYHTIKNDIRVTKLKMDEDGMEKLFDEFMDNLKTKSVEEFRELLKETKFIEYWVKVGNKSMELKEVHDVLRNDKRYQMLEPLSSQREDIMREYITHLENVKLMEKEKGYSTVHTGRR